MHLQTHDQEQHGFLQASGLNSIKVSEPQQLHISAISEWSK